ncbi:unnamed protein product [Ilex paraguariensis]|uniref:Uncharacterized protein n=1 Tax=Ilex paraguariensis TaxID=185542 RepID=A0ABC8S896_9AQUA
MMVHLFLPLFNGLNLLMLPKAAAFSLSHQEYPTPSLPVNSLPLNKLCCKTEFFVILLRKEKPHSMLYRALINGSNKINFQEINITYCLLLIFKKDKLLYSLLLHFDLKLLLMSFVFEVVVLREMGSDGVDPASAYFLSRVLPITFICVCIRFWRTP